MWRGRGLWVGLVSECGKGAVEVIMREREGGRDLRIKGPSDSEIPSALPPFFWNWVIVFLVMGCNDIAGSTFSTSFMVATSSVYIANISLKSATEGLKVAVRYVSRNPNGFRASISRTRSVRFVMRIVEVVFGIAVKL